MIVGPDRSTRPESQVTCNGATVGLLVLSALSAMALTGTACMASCGRIRWTAAWITGVATAGLLAGALCCCRRPVRPDNLDPAPAPAQPTPEAEPAVPVRRSSNLELLPSKIRLAFEQIQASGGINPADVQRPRTLVEFAPLLSAGTRVDVLHYLPGYTTIDALESDIGSKCARLEEAAQVHVKERAYSKWETLMTTLREAAGGQIFVKSDLTGDPEFFAVTELARNDMSIYWWNWDGSRNRWQYSGGTIPDDTHYPLLVVVIHPEKGVAS